MSLPARKLATYDDLLTIPDDVRAEVIAGEVTVSPSPLPRHSTVQRSIGRFVGGPFDDDDGHGGPGGWWIFIEVDVRLGPNDIVRPDLAGWRRERLPRPGSVRPIDVVPDWVCEILSPSTATLDLGKKRALYARSGIPHLWIIDPERRYLESFTLLGEAWRLNATHDDTAVTRVPPFEAVELEIGRLFLPREADPTE